jgi:hypothetical protein
MPQFFTRTYRVVFYFIEPFNATKDGCYDDPCIEKL